MPDDYEQERSRETRDRAERALVALINQIGDETVELIVLGGLVPEVLTEGQEAVPAHLGTTDVDMLLVAHLDAEEDLVVLEQALQAIGFEPDRREPGWRWRGKIDDHTMKLEFLCDTETEREGACIPVKGCAQLTAMNLRGTGYVAKDWHWRNVSGEVHGSGIKTVRVRFAGLEGYLLSKCVTVRSRGAAKDFYDFAYVLIHNREGGPAEAATALRRGRLAECLPGLRSTFVEVRERYAATGSTGPTLYAEQMRLVDFETPEAQSRAAAVGAVDEFMRVLLA